MRGHDEQRRPPAEQRDPTAGDPDRPGDPSASFVPPADVAAAAPREPLGQRLALLVVGLGLIGAALGGGWFVADARLGLSATGGLGGVVLVLIAAILLGVGLLLAVGGLAFYVLAPTFAGPLAARRDVGSHRLVVASTLLIVMVANVGPLIYTAIFGAGGICSVSGFTTAALSVDAALIGVAYLRFIRPGILTRADLGLSRTTLRRNVVIGLGVGAAVLVVSAAIQAAMRAVGVNQTQLLDLQCIREFPLGGFLIVAFAGGVLAPIAEELYFRGYVFRSYLQAKSPVVAYVATSLLFATLHLNLPALLPILAMSMIFCYAYQRTGSIVPSVVGHALNNTAAFSILYFTNAPL